MKEKGNRIKILYLINGFKIGGAETMLFGLLKELDREKFEPVVVSINSIAEIGKKIEKEGIKVLSLDENLRLTKFSKYNPLTIFRLISIIKKLIPIIKKEKVKILHSHLFPTDFLGRIVSKICKVPIMISTIHCEKNSGELYEKLLRYTDNFCDIAITVSQNVARTVIEKGIISRGKLRVICNGVDLDRFDLDKNAARKKIRLKLGLEENQKILISIGRLTEQKGYPYLIEAVEALKKKCSDLALIILGEGEDGKELEKEVKTKNLKENILFLGNKDNVPEYLAASDIFVSSSLWEGLPLSVLEAMASRLPIVATKVGGLPEIIREGETGFLVESKNSKALAEKIGYLLSLSQEERKKIGENGRKLVEEKFTLERMVKDYENLYEEFLEKKKITFQQPPKICPVCKEGNEFKFIQDHQNKDGRFSLYECNYCKVQFWEPFKCSRQRRYDGGYILSGVIKPRLKRDWHKEFFKLYKNFPKGIKILDLGCSRGEFLAELQKRGHEVWGVDFNRSAIEIAKKYFNLENVYPISFNEFFKKKDLPQFDIITFFEVIEHLDNPLEFIQNVKRLLKPTGRIVLSVPSRERMFLNFNPWDYPPLHLTRWNKEAISSLFQKINFEILNIRYVNDLSEIISGRLGLEFVNKTKNILNNYPKLTILIRIVYFLAYYIKDFIVGIFLILFSPVWLIIGKIMKHENGDILIELTLKQPRNS